MFYPLFFKPVYKNIIWGGRNFEKLFKRNIPDGTIAESWDICCHKNGMSIIATGEFEGLSLEALILEHGSLITGKKAEAYDRFPILVKLIDANGKLSVQVHPDNDYALKKHGEYGKTEMWYIMDAKPGAKIVYGTSPNTTKENFGAAIKDGSIDNHLNYVAVKKGDSIFIPAGTIHAILEGLVIAEIQQNSDTTYRVFDWNRVDSNNVPRELHVQSALDVINFDFKGSLETSEKEIYQGYTKEALVCCEFFKVDKLNVSSSYSDSTSSESFIAYTVVEGNGSLLHENKVYEITKSTSFLLPSAIGEYRISGSLELLKTYL
jgi:mannose-6-phosphate isomerase